MRVVKTSTDDEDFRTDEDFEHFFSKELPARTPPGKFRVTDGRIKPGGLAPEEHVLFQYNGKIRRIARSESGLKINLDNKKNQYPYYFVVDLESMFKVSATISDINNKFEINLATQGWNHIPEPKASEIWNYLCP